MIDRRPYQRLMMLSSEATPCEQFSSLHPCRSVAIRSRSYHSMLWQALNDKLYKHALLWCDCICCNQEDSSIFSVWSVFNGSNVCEFNDRSLQHSFSCSTRAPQIDTRMTAVPAELCFVTGINVNNNNTHDPKSNQQQYSWPQIKSTTILMTPNPVNNINKPNINKPKSNH